MLSLSINCMKCGAGNEIIATEAPENTTLLCSHCQKPIGRWRELVSHGAGKNGTIVGELSGDSDWGVAVPEA